MARQTVDYVGAMRSGAVSAPWMADHVGNSVARPSDQKPSRPCDQTDYLLIVCRNRRVLGWNDRSGVAQMEHQQTQEILNDLAQNA